MDENRLNLALNLGATNVINAMKGDVISRIAALLPQGADCAIECSGIPEVMTLALRSVRARGGRAVVVGNAKFGEIVSIDPIELNRGKALIGCWGGGSNPDADYSWYCDHVKNARIKTDHLTKNIYPLEDVNRALDDLRRGTVMRPILDMLS